MRASASSQTSTAEICRAPTASRISRAVRKGGCVTRVPMTRGTRKRPVCGAGSGALASASSLLRPGRGSSARSAGIRDRTCDVGGTPVVSIVLNLFRVLEHVRQLLHEQIFLGVAQFEARERGDAIDVGACQPFRHAKCYHAAMVTIRRAAVAGSWYPSDPGMLSREVDRYLAAAGDPPAGTSRSRSSRHTPASCIRARLRRMRTACSTAGTSTSPFSSGPSHYVAFDGVGDLRARRLRDAVRARPDRRGLRGALAQGLTRHRPASHGSRARAFTRDAAAVSQARASRRLDCSARDGLSAARNRVRPRRCDCRGC